MNEVISRVNSIYSLYSGLRSIEHARNRPFSSCLKPQFQSQVKGEANEMQMRSLEKTNSNQTFLTVFSHGSVFQHFTT